MVHFEAARRGLPVLPRAELPRLCAVLRSATSTCWPGRPCSSTSWSQGRSPLFAGFWAFVVGGGRQPVAARHAHRRSAACSTLLAESAQSALPVALACATVGIVVGVVSATGLGLKLASGIVGIAQGNMLATLAADHGRGARARHRAADVGHLHHHLDHGRAGPGRSSGCRKLAAHMFVFYFGILADLTPPTAISTYATSSIAGRRRLEDAVDGHDAGPVGLHHSLQLRLRPCAAPLNASVPHIVLRTAAATLGIVMLGAGLIGYLPGRHARLGARGAARRGPPPHLSGRLGAIVGAACFIAVWLAQVARIAPRAAADGWSLTDVTDGVGSHRL